MGSCAFLWMCMMCLDHSIAITTTNSTNKGQYHKTPPTLGSMMQRHADIRMRTTNGFGGFLAFPTTHGKNLPMRYMPEISLHSEATCSRGVTMCHG